MKHAYGCLKSIVCRDCKRRIWRVSNSNGSHRCWDCEQKWRKLKEEGLR